MLITVLSFNAVLKYLTDKAVSYNVNDENLYSIKLLPLVSGSQPGGCNGSARGHQISELSNSDLEMVCLIFFLQLFDSKAFF